MALLWCDGFDHYGTVGNLTEGVYAESSGANLNTSNPRTGTHALSLVGGTLRRILGGPKIGVGIGAAFFYMTLPSSNNTSRIFDFRDAANSLQLSIGCQSTGVIEVKRGTLAGGTSLGVTASPVIVAGAYQHIEAFAVFDNSTGSVEVRVNGVTVFSVSGVDTVNTANVECSQVAISGGAGTTNVLIDDLFCYDDTGSANNTFIGDRRVITLFPNADTAQADWTAVGAASGYQAIDEANPDGDTSYITAGPPGSPGPISEFALQDLPGGVSAINGVVIVEFARKTEAGPANTQWSLVSGASETAGADNPMTEVYTYRQNVFEVDPASAAPFTPAEVDGLIIKVERTQ